MFLKAAELYGDCGVWRSRLFKKFVFPGLMPNLHNNLKD